MSETKVYQALDEHQVSLSELGEVEESTLDDEAKRRAKRLAEWMKEFHRWKAIYVSDFKIQLPPVAFCIKATHSNCYGYFRPGHNELGLTREIAINRLYIEQREPWQVLGTLLHELLHAWQDKYGKPGKRNYHNREFHEKAKGFGLIVERNGYTLYAPDSPFMRLLKKHGIQVPDLKEPVRVPPVRGTSTLGRWVCGCKPPVCLRVGRAEIRVQCLDCGVQFCRQD